MKLYTDIRDEVVHIICYKDSHDPRLEGTFNNNHHPCMLDFNYHCKNTFFFICISCKYLVSRAYPNNVTETNVLFFSSKISPSFSHPYHIEYNYNNIMLHYNNT